MLHTYFQDIDAIHEQMQEIRKTIFTKNTCKYQAQKQDNKIVNIYLIEILRGDT